MLKDPALLGSILDGLLLWQAAVINIADGGTAIRVSADQTRVVDAMLNRLLTVGSPALRSAISFTQRPPG